MASVKFSTLKETLEDILPKLKETLKGKRIVQGHQLVKWSS